MRYRLIKPEWAKTETPGENSIEGDDFSREFLEEKNALGYGIYYFPNYNSQPVQGYLAGRHVDVFEWVYVDMDLKDGKYASQKDFVDKLEAFEKKPNKIIYSGNGVHAYWRVVDLDRETFVALQLKLIRQFDTDKSIWTILRCMRLEGFYNTKKKEAYRLVEAEQLTDAKYTVAELAATLPDLPDEDVTKMVNHLRKVEGLNVVQELGDIDLETLPASFEKLIERNERALHCFTDDTEGKRSDNAWQLGHILFDRGFPREEAVAVIANTPKALSKGSRNVEFAIDLVDKLYHEKLEFVVPSASQMIKENSHEKRRGRLVKGPAYFDCLYRGWRTQQCLGLIGGTGIGKSTVSLDIFMGMIRNNPDSDDIYLYFNLEMPAWEVIEKWQELTDRDPKLAERLYVISNEDDEGNPRHISPQHIYWYCRDIHRATGKKIAAITIDHIAVINPTIDIRKKPDFGLTGEMENSFGDLRNVSPRKMPQVIKELAKQLDCFIIIQSQTTKDKGGDGDTPLPVHAAYGASQFEHYMDYIITLWQPLRRVHDRTDLRVLGWQYCKIRAKSKHDKLDTYSPRYLGVDIGRGSLYITSAEENEQFEILNKEAMILRKKAEKKESSEYKPCTDLAMLRVV